MIIIAMSFGSIAAVVSDNDGSAFITKSEFDSLKNDFQAQINQYNTSIDSKIDAAISQYLTGIKVSTKTTLKSILNDINSYGYNYNNMAGYPFTNGNINIACTEQQPRVYAVGVFCFQNLCCNNTGTMWSGAHHCGGVRTNNQYKSGQGTAWEFSTINGYKCLAGFVNVFEVLNFAISDAPAKHDPDNWGLAHTYQSSVRNTTTNLNTENVTAWTGGFLMRNSSGNYSSTTLSSGGAYLTLSKSIHNTSNSLKKGYMAPINTISTTGTGNVGYGYDSGTILGDILTNKNPMTGSTATDNVQVTFPNSLYYAHHTGECKFSNTAYPATQYAYEYLYWNRHYVNTSKFDLTQLYVYPATMAYGEGVRYYNGLPICTNKTQKGILTFSLKPTTTTSGTRANKVQLCFRTKPFANMNPGSDSSNNMKNVYYKQQGTTTWIKCNNSGGVENLAPGTTYDFMIEDFPENTTLWVKPYTVQNTSSTSTQVYAFLSTVGDIVIEKVD